MTCSPLLDPFLFLGLCVPQATLLILPFIPGLSGPYQPCPKPGGAPGLQHGAHWLEFLGLNPWPFLGCPDPFKRSSDSRECLVLGQEILVTGIFTPGRTGTEAKAK